VDVTVAHFHDRGGHRPVRQREGSVVAPAEVGEEAAERLMTGVLPTEGSGFRELHIQQAMVDSSIEWLDQAFLPLRPAALEALETQAGAH
jgi:hypothetical protein